jgi:hypothetical protein
MKRVVVCVGVAVGCAFPDYEFRPWDAAISARDTPPARDVPVICTPATEVCNGRDDDCNGQTDEVAGDGTAEHCGRCNNRCPPGWGCTQRLCCPPGAAACPDRNRQLQCVLTESDVSHCGACGRACSTEQVCHLGVCRPRCGPGESLCGSSSPQCANLQNDPTNCGTCGFICTTGWRCEVGRCVSF